MADPARRFRIIGSLPGFPGWLEARIRAIDELWFRYDYLGVPRARLSYMLRLEDIPRLWAMIERGDVDTSSLFLEGGVAAVPEFWPKLIDSEALTMRRCREQGIPYWETPNDLEEVTKATNRRKITNKVREDRNKEQPGGGAAWDRGPTQDDDQG